MLHQLKNNFAKPGLLALLPNSQRLIYVLLFFLGFLLTLTIAYLDYQEKRLKTITSSSAVLTAITSRLENTLYQKLSVIPAIIALVKAEKFEQPDDANKHSNFEPVFDKFSDELNRQINGVTSIQLAPDAIVTLMSNKSVNKAALGHDLLVDDARRVQVIDAISRREQITIGPIELIQGGQAIISRKAVFSDVSTSPAKRYVASGRVALGEHWLDAIPTDFWGLATVVLDANIIYKEADLSGVDAEYRLGIRSLYESGEVSDVFWGDETVFNNPIATKNVSMPGGEWIIAISSSAFSWLSTILIMLLGSLFTFLLVFSFHAQRLRNIELIKSKAKSDFLTKMSHELRTPLNGIIGFSDLINLRHTELSEKNQQYLQHIRHSSKSLLSLINDLLDLSLIDSGKFRLNKTRFALIEIVQNTARLLAQEAEEKNITIKIDMTAEQSIFLETDQERLQQILINLISNAIKYNKINGLVTISVAEVNESNVEIQVIDSGIGISEEKISDLFKMFERLEVDTKVKGVGVGLVIVKNLVDLMGGNISVFSDVGEGTTFSVLLPKILHEK